MYIIRNAMRCIGRSKGRNVLIGIIVLVIALSCCLGLSIRQAAENARKEALDTVTVTGTISFDRMSAMSGMKPPQDQTSEGGQGGFDREQFKEMMGQSSALTLEEYKTYATASSVKDFYYTATININGSDVDPVSSDQSSDDSESSTGSMQMPSFGGMGGGPDQMMQQIMGAQSDFTLVGYSAEKAMTAFIDGTASVTTGAVFTEGTEELQCIISEELATYNDLAVGDTMTLCNPNNEEEVYELSIVGFYTDSSANENSFSMMGMTSGDPANKIYMSYVATAKIISASEEASSTLTDENGREFETALTATLDATYVFADAESFELFEEQVRELGLDESYTVSSADINAFESSLAPLETLSKTAGYFLIVILVIGAVILVVLNIFNVRERKYEIGVLTAMGMKKSKVAAQFIIEIFAVTIVAVIIGAAVGAVTAVPVTNALLESQATSQQNRFEAAEQNFGRGEMPDMNMGGMPNMPGGIGGNRFGEMFGQTPAEAITQISSATDLTVLAQMLGIAVLLTLVAGAASMLFIMRYEPLRILSNRD